MRYFYITIIIFFTIFACKKPQARKPILIKSGVSLSVSAERTKKRLEVENTAISNYIRKDSTQTYQNSNYGFKFTYLQKDSLNTVTPKHGDKITYTYSILNLKNDTLYNEQEVGTKTHYIRQENIIEGLRQGLILMKENETVKFIFPSQIAYGYKGDLNKINHNTPIIYNVHIHKIESNINNK